MEDHAKKTELNKAQWDRWAGTLDAKGWRRDFLRRGQRKVISLLELKRGIHFLDIGCGTGWAVGEVAELAEGQGEFFGVDLSPKMIERARQNFDGRREIHFLEANVESIPLDSDFFDIIICTNSFHHYPRPDRALAEMQRLLRSGGRVFILDPTANSWIYRVADKVVRVFEPAHVKMYSSREFQQMFRNAGLESITSQSVRAISKEIHVGQK